MIPGARYYRFDGASRSQGIHGAGVAGWGAAMWNAGKNGEGDPDGTTTGFLGEGVSNNVSEYAGMLACLTHAAEDAKRTTPTYPIVIQGDSMLVMRQTEGAWACRAASLRTVYEECCRLLRELRGLGVDIRIEHTYREFNTTADALSNEAVDRPDRCGPSAGWVTA